MVVPLGEESRISIPVSVLDAISDLTREQSQQVQTELKKITAAGYAPSTLVYKQYGDLKVFRCGDEMRLFGVVVEDVDAVEDFDHLVILLEVSKHEYEHAGVSKEQANDIQQTVGGIRSEAEFWNALDGRVFDEDDIDDIL